MPLVTKVSYAGRGWYRWNAAFVLVVGVAVAVAVSWWIGALLVVGGLIMFCISENLLPRLAQRRAARNRLLS
jgi:drug/metabolite transporter (DMT)-like permease